MVKITANIFEKKKAWIRIVEAAIAIMLVMSVLLVVMLRKPAPEKSEDEILKLEQFILTQVSEDPALRGDILSKNLDNVNTRVGELVPDWLNYNVSVCEPAEICSLCRPECPADYIVEGKTPEELYAQEILVVANVTNYNPVRLKLFLWRKT